MAIIDPAHAARQLLYERIFRSATLAAAVLVLVILGGVVVSLLTGAWPALKHFGFGFVTREVWNPVTEQFGALAPIYGTVMTSVIAMVLAVPAGFGVALFLTELCPPLLKRPIGVAVELLAAVPSIIYGIWGLFVLAPILQHSVQPWLIHHPGTWPGIGSWFKGPPFGIGIFTAGVVLAIMVLPFIAATMRDVFDTVPAMLKESGYGLGATTWEVIWNVVVPHSRVGIVGGIMLGLGRALGETMAVTFVIGNAHRISSSILAPGTTISSAIANEFTEAVGDLYTSSLIALGLLLFIITFAVIAAAQLMLSRLEKRGRGHYLSRRAFRKVTNAIFLSLSLLATLVGLACLAAILWTLISHGTSGFSLAIFTEMTPPPGSKGGLLNAIYGSAVMTLLGILIGSPIGVLAGTYLAEYGKNSRISTMIRFINDVLLSAPSIIIGLFVYEILVVPMKHFSALAGAVSLAILAIPVTLRTTEDMLNLVPSGMKDSSAALGAYPWRTTLSVLYPAARSGIVTGLLLAIARISGETAPLLFTALNNQFWSKDLNAPMANLPVVIFQFALSPYKDWQDLAWAGALVITVSILILSISARVIIALLQGQRGAGR